MRVSVSVGLGNRPEVCDELVFSTYLQIISGFGLPVLHGIFFHAHECGTRIGLGIGVTFSKGYQGDCRIPSACHDTLQVP